MKSQLATAHHQLSSITVDAKTATLIQQVLLHHAELKLARPLDYSSQFIDSRLFNDRRIAHHLSTISDDSFEPILMAIADSLPYFSCYPIVVLNIGSGEGVLTKFLIERFSGLNIIDLDLSPEMLELSVAHEHIVADVLDMPLSDGYVDIVLSHCTLRYISVGQRARFYREVQRILKPSGAAIVAETNLAVAEQFETVLRETNVQTVVKDDNVRMFRCSRFYRLYEEYQNSAAFREAIDKTIQSYDISLLDFLEQTAGYKNGQVRVIKFGR